MYNKLVSLSDNDENKLRVNIKTMYSRFTEAADLISHKLNEAIEHREQEEDQRVKEIERQIEEETRNLEEYWERRSSSLQSTMPRRETTPTPRNSERNQSAVKYP